MRLFWSIFFLGSMLLVGVDVLQQRQSAPPAPNAAIADGDAIPIPTPN
jgi:hypothetical protein